MKFLQNIIALVIFLSVAALLIYVGVYILLAVLIVMAVAFTWFGVKFYFLRKQIAQAVHQYQGTRFSDATPRGQRSREDEGGPVIEGEFEEVDEEKRG